PVRGVVKDERGQELAGVEVRNLRTAETVVSGSDGTFIISANPDDRIQFKSVGYGQVVLSASEIANVQLSLEESVLDEVVVVGYGAQKRQNLTGSVATVNFKESTTSRPTMNMASTLVGLSPGLNIAQTSATPGGEGYNILLRGQGTMNDASPLVVIDGVPGALNDVNPSDVASVSVLKDASSAAIYGSRAANGVILVTTKRGNRDSKYTFSYNGYVGSQSAANDIDYITDMATHMEMVNESEGREKYANDLIDEW